MNVCVTANESVQLKVTTQLAPSDCLTASDTCFARGMSKGRYAWLNQTNSEKKGQGDSIYDVPLGNVEPQHMIVAGHEAVRYTYIVPLPQMMSHSRNVEVETTKVQTLLQNSTLFAYGWPIIDEAWDHRG